jgi:L-threonylcarbamoyladenylate synthase
LVERAAQILREGGVVAFPTETVYGLGADAENEAAVRRVFEIKGRPIGHPVIVHVADLSQLDDWAREIPKAALILAERFWPGPLTIVLARTSRASDLVTGSQDTVALRAPSHPLAQAILREFGGGVVAPSANRFGTVSATRAEHVIADFGEAVDFVVDGGPATIGVESTIVDLSHGEPAILRPGGITREQLAQALGVPVREGGTEVRVPGSLASHYAPRARVELAENDAVAEGLASALRSQGKRVSLIGSSEVSAFARDLYERLRAADREGADAIVVVLPPNEGIGVALRDRLRRAASATR